MYEFTFDGFSAEQCAQYLDRIHATFDGNATMENLNDLIFRHQTNVPFEDLAVCDHWGTVSLEPEALFDKIVTSHRGGFCFELNGAFLLLLKGLGFDVAGVMCRIGIPAFGVLRRLDHRGILATFDGKEYYVDVGMGGPKPAKAIPLSGEKISFGNGVSYWIEDTDRGWKMLKNDGPGKDGSCIIFAPIAMLPFDFYGNCYEMLDRGNTVFHTTRMVNLTTEDGYIQISGQMLNINRNGEETKREYDDAELPELLRTYFGIEYQK
ncbi:MAG: arylamine N-acetyltransferase [Lachnospiraceae bacterium]|nr:arylamine N-acetyltransferase [Lachnospiraceae bacterium]